LKIFKEGKKWRILNNKNSYFSDDKLMRTTLREFTSTSKGIEGVHYVITPHSGPNSLFGPPFSKSSMCVCLLGRKNKRNYGFSNVIFGRVRVTIFAVGEQKLLEVYISQHTVIHIPSIFVKF